MTRSETAKAERLPCVNRILNFFKFLVIVAASLMLMSQREFAKHTGIKTKLGTIKVETVAKELQHPWCLTFLPDGRMLVTERPGRLRIITRNGSVSGPLKGVPTVYNEVEAGLYDVAIDPDFTSNQLIYLAYAEPGEGGFGTAVARAKLSVEGLDAVQVIFRQQPKVHDYHHFGGRLAFSPDGKLFVTLGERFQFESARDLSTHLGKIVRINRDGSVPDDNPFVRQEGRLPEIWSYGHRNPQGAAFHPVTGRLWESELGPLGGDELNVVEAGKDYGWPVVSWGRHRDGTEIPVPPTHPEFADAVYYWNPVVSPSGITFYTADTIPGWKGNLLVAGLSSEAIIRLTLDGQKVVDEERIPMGRRIRDVVQGPDGAIYALTDEVQGRILRLTIDRPLLQWWTQLLDSLELRWGSTIARRT